ncbi:MAG: hypothetical protein ABEJ79_00470 [Halolamina sp.]
MKKTAALHTSFAVFAGVGLVLSEPLLRVGAFAVAVACFIAGIVVARRDGDDADAVTEAS